MSRRRKIVLGMGVLLIVGFLILQIIPIGSLRPALARVENPAVSVRIDWDSAETEQLTRAACFDCHSNETTYPWYAHIAPVSWLVSWDVNRGRQAMNFSVDAPTDYDLADLEWHVTHDMPPSIYVIMHPEANLTEDQKALLLAGFAASLTEASDEGMDMGG
jgi:hypothetical protein